MELMKNGFCQSVEFYTSISNNDCIFHFKHRLGKFAGSKKIMSKFGTPVHVRLANNLN